MLWLLVTITLMTLIAGCATTPVSSSFEPRSMNEIRFRDRSQSKYDDQVRVTVAVPTAEENQALFIPGSTLLGFANTDHWDIAMPVREQYRFWGRPAHLPEFTEFPRDILLEALVLFSIEQLLQAHR